MQRAYYDQMELFTWYLKDYLHEHSIKLHLNFILEEFYI